MIKRFWLAFMDRPDSYSLHIADGRYPAAYCACACHRYPNHCPRYNSDPVNGRTEPFYRDPFIHPRDCHPCKFGYLHRSASNDSVGFFQDSHSDIRWRAPEFTCQPNARHGRALLP